MIALNELIKNKEEFAKRYELMGKKYNLDKIVDLEQKFIVIDQKKNTARATSNKLCSQVADLINNNKSTIELIQQINQLDKQILHDEHKSSKAMAKINKHLSKLPNLPIDDNILNISYKTSANPDFTFNQFMQELSKIAKPQSIKNSPKRYLKSIRNRVIKHENLPQCMLFQSKKYQKEIIMLLDHNSKLVFDSFVSTLTNNAYLIVEKSIKSINRVSSKEILVRLCDNTIAQIQYVGEYISREINLKFYDKNLDMTRFVNIIKIKIKCHG